MMWWRLYLKRVTTTERALRSLSLTDDDYALWVRRFQASARTGLLVRTTFREVVPILVEVLAPSRVHVVKDVLSLFPERFVWSMCPIGEAVLAYVAGGHAVYPTLPLAKAATRMLVESMPVLLEQTPVFRPIFQISADDPQLFMDIATESSHIFFFQGGYATHHRDGPSASTIHYEDYPVLIMEPLFLGFYQGLLNHLGRTLREVRFEVLTPREGVIDIRWEG